MLRNVFALCMMLCTLQVSCVSTKYITFICGNVALWGYQMLTQHRGQIIKDQSDTYQHNILYETAQSFIPEYLPAFISHSVTDICSHFAVNLINNESAAHKNTTKTFESTNLPYVISGGCIGTSILFGYTRHAHHLYRIIYPLITSLRHQEIPHINRYIFTLTTCNGINAYFDDTKFTQIMDKVRRHIELQTIQFLIRNKDTITSTTNKALQQDGSLPIKILMLLYNTNLTDNEIHIIKNIKMDPQFIIDITHASLDTTCEQSLLINPLKYMYITPDNTKAAHHDEMMYVPYE